MKKFIVFNKEESIFTEKEIETNSEFGMDAEVKFWHPYLGLRHVIFHNLTEVHYFFNREELQRMREWNGRSKRIPEECFHSKNSDLSYSPRCAFESDLHGTGGHRGIPIMESLEVRNSVKMHDEYMEILEEVSSEESAKAWRESRNLDDECLYK